MNDGWPEDERWLRSPGFVADRSNRAGQECGGADLNENTTRLVVCIPVLASPSCCNPIFTYARIHFALGWTRNGGSALGSRTGDGNLGLARVSTELPSGTLSGPRSFSSFRPGLPGRLLRGFNITRNEHRHTSGGGQISGMASPATTDHTW